MAESRDAALALADKYNGINATARAFELAWAHSQVVHMHRTWSPESSHLYQRLASYLLFAGTALRAHAQVLASNRLGPPDLWHHGIASDRPILLARIAEPAELTLARQLLVAHEFLRLKGLDATLILLSEGQREEDDGLSEQIRSLVQQEEAREQLSPPGRILVLERGSLSEDECHLLEASARVILHGVGGPCRGSSIEPNGAGHSPSP